MTPEEEALRNRAIACFEKIGLDMETFGQNARSPILFIEDALRAAVLEEREACARIADTEGDPAVAAAIRKRPTVPQDANNT